MRVDTSVLRSGAHKAEVVCDMVGTARQAAADALAPGAFGWLCSPLLLPVYQVAKTAADLAMAAAGSGVERSAGNLRTVATDLDTAEELSLDDIDRAAARL
jgi:hypothetical protein